MLRAIATAVVTSVALAACGGGHEVRLVVELAGEARATDLQLRVGDDTRFYETRAHGEAIVERDVPEETRVTFRARNGGDGGELVLRAFVDGCEVESQSCEGAGCVGFLEITVRGGC